MTPHATEKTSGHRQEKDGHGKARTQAAHDACRQGSQEGGSEEADHPQGYGQEDDREKNHSQVGEEGRSQEACSQEGDAQGSRKAQDGCEEAGQAQDDRSPQDDEEEVTVELTTETLPAWQGLSHFLAVRHNAFQSEGASTLSMPPAGCGCAIGSLQ